MARRGSDFFNRLFSSVTSIAQRAGTTITGVEGSHVIMISQPQGVTDVVMQAMEAIA